MILRQKFSLLAIILAFGLILLRLSYWQIAKAQELSFLGLSQYGTLVDTPAKRGDIKSKDGFSLATNKVSYLLYANPKQIKDKEKTANVLANILDIKVASISAALQKNLFWTPIAPTLSTKTKEVIEKLNIEGLGFEKQYKRFYPEASMSAHLLGFVGKDEAGNDKGYFGIEGFYDRLLKGKDGKILQVHDALGRLILNKIVSSNEIDGADLTLSIERPIQYSLEKKLLLGIEKYGAKGGMAGVINPKTGEILAMASYPSFDPGNFTEFNPDDYKNPFISNLYEPGSTFKPVVMSSALEEKVITPQTKCTICQGPVPIGDYVIHTWNDKYYKNTNMVEVIQHSDNTGMVFVAKKLGLDRLLQFFGKFGIGQRTGVDLQGETAPGLKPKDSWYPVDLATASFGQGISITAMELLDAVSAIANGGRRMEPHVVSEITTPNGETIKIQPKVLDTPISANTAKVMTEIMVNAVEKGEASWTKLKGYRIAGKTGTASIPIKGHYDPNQTIASFVGFGPADDPKFVMLVVLDRPTVSIYGAETAAPIFFSVAKDILDFYGVPPSENP